MIRNGRAFAISLTLHAAIAAAAIFALQSFSSEKPGEDAKLCIALSHFSEPVAKAPEVKPEPEANPPLKPKSAPKPKTSSKKPDPVIAKPKPVEVEPEPVVTVPEPEPAPPEPETESRDDVEEDTVDIEAVADAAHEADCEMPPEMHAETAATEAVPAMSAGERYLQEHLAIISRLLQENLYYPRIARKRGIMGEVIVAFELQGSGEAARISVVSGDREILKKAAVTTIERLSGRFPKPGEPITLRVPIRYELH